MSSLFGKMMKNVNTSTKKTYWNMADHLDLNKTRKNMSSKTILCWGEFRPLYLFERDITLEEKVLAIRSLYSCISWLSH